MRKIIHLDMDCFYAAVEMRENPKLANVPIAVGGGSKRGIVTTCNYVARKYGVRSAMPGFIAKQLCPQIVFVPVRFDLYREASTQIRKIFLDYTDRVEPLSLDEAYLDVSHADRYAWDIAKEIRARIVKTTQLTGSAGIAPNKMLAKIASDWRKPNGQFAILPDQVESFIAHLPIRKIWGIGPKSAERFASQGIHICADLQKFSLPQMSKSFGKWGEELYKLCRGQDEREVCSDRVRKSLSNENTFSDLLVSLDECQNAITDLAQEMLQDVQLRAPNREIHKAFVKVKFADFTRTTKECVCSVPTVEIFRILLAEAFKRKPLPIRLLGTGVRFLDETEIRSEHPDLFEL